MFHNSLSLSFLNSCKKYEFNNDNLKNILYKKEQVNKQEEKKKNRYKGS